jgi:hypothetical protein
MRNPGVSQELTGLAAAVQLRLRAAIGLQTLRVKCRLVTGENSVRIRGEAANLKTGFRNKTLRVRYSLAGRFISKRRVFKLTALAKAA